MRGSDFAPRMRTTANSTCSAMMAHKSLNVIASVSEAIHRAAPRDPLPYLSATAG
jgi:hypothetical protein